MTTVIKRINQWIIAVLLVITYIVAVGIARVVYVFSRRRQGQGDSYWIVDDASMGECTRAY